MGKLGINWQSVFLVVIFILLLAGGLGLYLQSVRLMGVLFAVAALVLLLFSRQKLNLPKGFFLFFVFLVLLGANVAWSREKLATLEYLVMFAGGGVIWLLFYNMGEKFKANFERLLLILGIVFGVSLIINWLVFPELPVRPWSLYLPGPTSRMHNHLGDLWATVVIIVVHKLLTKPRWWHWVVSAMGVYFLAISLSRSAYLALAVGIVYLFNQLGLTKKFKRLYIIFLLLVTGLFLYAAFFKSTLLARPYFGQVLWGLFKWPWGVGVGNFGIISSDIHSPWWDWQRVGIISSLTHNIILEILAGMGILGFIFVGWLTHVLMDLFKHSKQTLFSAVFLAITVNFMFDTTYYIPTMLWLWFASLGLAQVGENKDKIAKFSV